MTLSHASSSNRSTVRVTPSLIKATARTQWLKAHALEVKPKTHEDYRSLSLGVSNAVSNGPDDEEAAGSDGALTCGLVLPG